MLHRGQGLLQESLVIACLGDEGACVACSEAGIMCLSASSPESLCVLIKCFLSRSTVTLHRGQGDLQGSLANFCLGNVGGDVAGCDM